MTEPTPAQRRIAEEIVPLVFQGTDYDEVPIAEILTRARYLHLKQRLLAIVDKLAPYDRHQDLRNLEDVVRVLEIEDTDEVPAKVVGDIIDEVIGLRSQLAAQSPRDVALERVAEAVEAADKCGRIVIVHEGGKWYARRLRLSEHDLDRDEKVYRCDKPLVNDCATLAEALAALKEVEGG